MDQPPPVPRRIAWFAPERWSPRWLLATSLAEVRDAAGHANVGITSAYLHVAVEDESLGRRFE